MVGGGGVSDRIYRLGYRAYVRTWLITIHFERKPDISLGTALVDRHVSLPAESKLVQSRCIATQPDCWTVADRSKLICTDLGHSLCGA